MSATPRWRRDHHDRGGRADHEEIPRTILTSPSTQAQAEQVIFACRNGDLSFALRTRKTNVPATGPGVTAADIMPEVFAGSAS